MLIARFVSHKNRLIKVIRTEKNSSPFKVCLKATFEGKKNSFRRNFQIILLSNKLCCLYKTGQISSLACCCAQRGCTNVQGESKFISNKWSRNSSPKNSYLWSMLRKNVKSREERENYLVKQFSNSPGKICTQTMWHINQFKVYPKINILCSSKNHNKITFV